MITEMRWENNQLESKTGQYLYVKTSSQKDRSFIVVHEFGKSHKSLEFLTDDIDSEEEQYNFTYFDLRGHGRSGGSRGHIDDFHIYAEDLYQVIERYQGKKETFLFMDGNSWIILAALFKDDFTKANSLISKLIIHHPKIEKVTIPKFSFFNNTKLEHFDKIKMRYQGSGGLETNQMSLGFWKQYQTIFSSACEAFYFIECPVLFVAHSKEEIKLADLLKKHLINATEVDICSEFILGKL